MPTVKRPPWGETMSASVWSRVAGTYEADHLYITGPDLVSAMQSKLAETIPNGDVIELGCGTGLFTRAYAPHCRAVIATDIALPMLEEASRNLPAMLNVSLQAADATGTGLPSQSADAVVLVNLLHIVPEPTAVLVEARRLLRPGGVVVVVDATLQGVSIRHRLSCAWRMISRWGLIGRKDLNRDKLEGLVRAAGFQVLEASLIIGQSMNAAFVQAVRAR